MFFRCRALRLIFLTFIASSVFAQSGDRGAIPCFVRNLPTQVPSEVKRIRIERHFFAAGPSSTAELHIENALPKPIIAMRLVFEYYGTQGERLGDVIAQGIAKQVPEDQAFPIGKSMERGSGPEELPAVLEPDHTVSLGGLGWFATAVCPARARLTAARLWFSDRTSFDWHAPDSRIDPQSDELHLTELPACLLAHNMDRLFLTLDVDATGRVQKVAEFPPDPSRKDPCDVREVGAWKFRPALLGGKQVTTKLNILLRLLPASNVAQFGDLPLSRREALHPVTVVDALAPAHSGAEWHILYAGILYASAPHSALPRN